MGRHDKNKAERFCTGRIVHLLPIVLLTPRQPRQPQAAAITPSKRIITHWKSARIFVMLDCEKTNGASQIMLRGFRDTVSETKFGITGQGPL